MNVREQGFTFIEVVACLLVVSLGIAAAVGLTFYAQILAERAQAKATGMATALSVTLDAAPLLHAHGRDNWTSAGPNGVGTTTGWINGYYVVRVESRGSQPCAGFASNPVSVDVYDGFRGHLVASYTTRLMKQDATP